MNHKVVYKTLEMEMIRFGFITVSLAKKIGIKYATMARKLRGETGFYITEAIAIKKALGTDKTIEELFSKEK